MTMKRVVIAIDSLKGSATSREIGTWVQEGIAGADATLETTVVPIADGGEGTLAALLAARPGQLIVRQVTGPLGQPVAAKFAMLDATTAVIEMAEAAGLGLTHQTAADALAASTYGVGQLLLAAAELGARTVYMGLGGSATTDGGAGLAQAIGVRLEDSAGHQIPRGAQGLSQLARVDAAGINPQVAGLTIRILSDVQNPLCGPTGAAAVFGPQKGLNPALVQAVDGWLAHYDRLLESALGEGVANRAGAGAAGGLGAGLLAFTRATVTSGIDEILRLVGFEAKLRPGTLVVTGEGRLDNQSAAGKAPVGIARLAKAHGLPVVAVVGSRAAKLAASYAAGIDLVLPLPAGPQTLEEALDETRANAHMVGETIARLCGLLNRQTVDAYAERPQAQQAQ
ncbi:glycerate kinase [Lacticaseibacillus parakribbianus]|uniref:glycerate kinase n=1 Tax=Lacticaseibacillus parakribbianus TaxID=2970927 RepID=UPI0021CB0D51|nr:glycerate kinase [Lacticaseibacillus parakribbianus]